MLLVYSESNGHSSRFNKNTLITMDNSSVCVSTFNDSVCSVTVHGSQHPTMALKYVYGRRTKFGVGYFWIRNVKKRILF